MKPLDPASACAALGALLVAFPWIPHGCTRCSRGVDLWVVVLAGALWGLVSVLLSRGWAVRAAVLASALALGHLGVLLLVPAKPCPLCKVLLVLELGALLACLRGLGRPRVQALVLGAGLLAALPGAMGLRWLRFGGPATVARSVNPVRG